MRAKFCLGMASAALALACAGSAFAQEYAQTAPESDTGYMRSPVRAPENALEIGVNAGYSQGFGNLEQGEAIGNTADAGASIGLNLDYRATPGFSVGADASYQMFDADDSLRGGTDIRGMTAGVHGTFHFAPYERVDPHLTIGTGYRLLWEAPDGPNNNILTHGFDLAKLNVGLDVRVNDSVAVGPMVGADLTMFTWRNPEGSAGDSQIEDMGLSTFVYAGVQGRFDVGGERKTKIENLARR